MDAKAFRTVLGTLLRRYRPRNWAEGRDPFETLMSIIVSQNSTDLVTERVMADLRSRMPITAPSIAAARESDLVRVLRPAGLARREVPKIGEAAQVLVREYGGTMDAFLDVPTGRGREMLLALPGVGPKTADVWLSLVGGRATMPIDTHIGRLARRWHLVRPAASYAETTAALKALIPPSRRRRGHLALIYFGREICRARRPRCEVCPVYRWCDADVKRVRTRRAHATEL